VQHHCGQFVQQPISRRDMLARCACGFGGVAFSALLAKETRANDAIKPAKGLHHEPKVRNVIFLYMDGGPSHVDTFDPKPLLDKENGKPFAMKMEATQFDNNGKTLASPWKFKQYGESGIPVSELFPHVAKHADDMAVIRSMTSKFSEHTFANYFLHTGHGLQGRPSMGAWANYGLGSECDNLPGFVVLNGGLIPPGGLDNFGSGYLPASHQGSVFTAGDPPVANIDRKESSARLQQNKLALMKQLDAGFLSETGSSSEIESAIKNYELAFRMQAAVPELMDFADESPATLDMYGLNDEFKNTTTYGRICLIARRLVERGVRFIELTCPGGNGDRWDQHGNLRDGHTKNAKTVDKPISALLTDLKQRGLFDSTLVVWGGEFGRTPFAQGGNGRDHNPFGFTIWMAGGGVKGGTIYGRTDDYGYKAIENRVEIHDLHATMLHLLGVNHERLTYRFSGRDMRLTDVHGHVIRDILA
jgi:hypothetical protein